MDALSTVTLMPLEPLGMSPVLLVGRQDSDSAEYAVRTHFHPGIFELHFVVRGRLTYVIEGKAYAMGAGDMMLIPPGVPHGTGEEPLGRCERFWLQIRYPEHERPLPGANDADSTEIMRQLSRTPMRTIRGGDAVAALFERIRFVYGDQENPLRTVNLGNLILRLLLDFLALTERGESGVDGAGIGKTVRLIEKSRTPIAVAELARAAGMSESAFKVRFKKATGLPPAEYFTRHRLEMARHLLLTSSKTVTEIAHELEFQSSQHFSTVFRRYLGQTPGEFRSGDTDSAGKRGGPVSGAGPSFVPLTPLKPAKK